MAEILPGVHQVEGVDPSPDFSTHVWLVKDGSDRFTLIDTGLPGSEVALGTYLKKHNIPPRSVTQVLLTHLHRDHTGALRKVIELTGAKTHAHWLEAAFIAGKPPYEGPGVPPAEPVEVDHRFKDGDRIDAAGGVIAYHTPGHTPGHTAYFAKDRKLVFSGDLFFGSPHGPILTVPEYTQHMGSAQVSARRIGELEFDALMTYHGGPYLDGGSQKVRALVAKF